MVDGSQGAELTRSNNDFDASALINAVASTASTDSVDQVNPYGRGVKVVVNLIAHGSGSITVTIQGKDPNGQYYTLLASASLATNGVTVMTVYPGLTAATNLVANDVLPRVWRVSVANGDTNPVNYTIGASVIV